MEIEIAFFAYRLLIFDFSFRLPDLGFRLQFNIYNKKEPGAVLLSRGRLPQYPRR